MTKDIVHTTLQQFAGRIGIKATWKNVRTKIKGVELDGYVCFHAGKQNLEIPAEIKIKVSPANLPQLQIQKQKLGKLLVLAGKIMPREQLRLKELGIFFIDGAGNAFIQQDGFFIHAEGRKIESDATIVADTRAFSKGGLKVIFQFFLRDDMINATMREIAIKTNVSLDTVHKTVNALKAMSYLISLSKAELVWNNKRELLTQWINEYERRLKPSLFISRFDFLHDKDYNRWKEIKLAKGKTCWGGEPAGELLTNNLKPGELTIYTTETDMELTKNYKMLPKKAGTMIVYKRFWPVQENETKFAPPLLVYADLVSTGERRNIEIAQRIFDEHLKDKF